MNDLRQAAQRLIDRIDREGASPLDWREYDALCTALVQQAEPVAWMAHQDKMLPTFHRTFTAARDWADNPTPLYTAPSQRKPLTDEQIIGAMHEDGCERIENFYVVGPVQKAAVFSFARAVEAKIKEGT